MMSAPVLWVCGHRKSGTTLVVNLLDDHPALAVYPYDLKVLYAYYPRFCKMELEPADARARLKRVFIEELRHRLGEDGGEGALNVDVLSSSLDDLADSSLADIDVVLRTIADGLRAQLPGSSLVLKETSIEVYAPWLLQRFEGARMVQVLRDPRDNFAALASGVGAYYDALGQSRAETLMSLLFRLEFGLRAAIENKRDFNGAFMSVKFEDVVTDSETTMRELAAWIGISWDDRLLVPTVFGRRTGGNSLDGTSFDGVSSANVSRWSERIRSDEACVIEHVLGDLMESVGYARHFATAQARDAAREFYAWANDRYFFADPFADKQTIRKPGR